MNSEKYPHLDEELEATQESVFDLYSEISGDIELNNFGPVAYKFPDHVKELANLMLTKGHWVNEGEDGWSWPKPYNPFSSVEEMDSWVDTVVELCNEVLKIELKPDDMMNRPLPDAYWMYDPDIDDYNISNHYSQLGRTHVACYSFIQYHVNHLYITSAGWMTREDADTYYDKLLHTPGGF